MGLALAARQPVIRIYIYLALPKLTPNWRKSNQRFLAELGLRPNLFAYPYGEYNLAVIERVKAAGFIAGFGQNSGIAHGYDGYFELPRFAMNEKYGAMDRLDIGD